MKLLKAIWHIICLDKHIPTDGKYRTFLRVYKR